MSHRDVLPEAAAVAAASGANLETVVAAAEGVEALDGYYARFAVARTAAVVPAARGSPVRSPSPGRRTPRCLFFAPAY